jgi:outer membrane protein assembly factor BamB
MWGRRTKWFLIFLLVICIVLAPIISMFQSRDNPTQKKLEPSNYNLQLNTNSGNQVEETESEDINSRSYSGGELEWSIKLSQNTEEAMLSTPAICDLNPPTGNYGKRYLETVVACTDDHIYVVDHNGKEKWVYSDCIIDDFKTIINRGNIQLDYTPPPIFSSITPIDIGGSKAPELFVGLEDGFVCLSPDGSKFWNFKCCTDGYYLPDFAVVDLEGDYMGMDIDGNFVGYREDLEILFGSFNTDFEQGFIECWQSNGQTVFRYEMSSLGQEYIVSNIVAAELDGWFFNNEKRLQKLRETNENQNLKTLATDIIITTDNSAGKIWKQSNGGEMYEYYEAANITGYRTFSSATVANFSGGQELECIVGTSSGGSTWETSEGTVLMYRQDGNLASYPFFTGPAPSSVFSSPASCDAQNILEKDLKPGQKIDYEVYFGCDNGIFYCLSGTDLSELWHYQTGGRILSSPAICNINSDDSLEVVVGSNDGKVYCFEGDPQELDLYGVPHPKDDGISDDGGDSGEFDLLWVFDTNTVEGSSGEIGISSPVVGDIDYDGELEVLIGDTEGTLYCISAGGECISGQVDWHKTHYDLNNTGFYKQNPFYGVKIEPQISHSLHKDNCKCYLEKTVRPGEIKFHNYTITNIGNHMLTSDIDRFYIQTSQFVYKNCNFEGKKGWPKPILTGEDLKWDGGKEGIGNPYVELKIFESTNISVAIRGPWTGDIQEYCDLKVEVNSSEHVWVRDSVQTRTLLDVYLDFDVEILHDVVKDKYSDLYGNKVIRLPPGGSATIEIEMQNLGNMNDSYDLQIKGVINGWEAYFEDTHSMIFLDALQLDAEIMAEPFIDYYQCNEGKVSFNITAPKEAQIQSIFLFDRKCIKIRYSSYWNRS